MSSARLGMFFGLVAGSSVLAGNLLRSDVRADPPRPTEKGAATSGWAACRACHNENAPVDAGRNPFAKQWLAHEFVRLDEARIWATSDPHAGAYSALEGPLGTRIATNMKQVLGYDVRQSPACLACHATDTAPGSPPLTGWDHKAGAPARFDTRAGVSCTACHGSGKAWQTEHHAEPQAPRTAPLWRTLDPAAKEKAGMRNLRDPIVAARLCVACHVGKPSEGKLLTHDMYAAGHPLLPPFELVTFLECAPPHWNAPTDPQMKFFTPKGFETAVGADVAKRNPNWTWELYRFHPADKEVYQARHVVAGIVAALEAEMNLVRASAADAERDRGTIDFAAFDCSVCHHDLAFPAQRQKRGFAGAPGRPPVRYKYDGAAFPVMAHAGKSLPALDGIKELQKKSEALDRAFQSRAFGTPKDIVTTSADLSSSCDAFLKALAAVERPFYTPTMARELLGVVRDAADNPANAARSEQAVQLAWAYLALRERVGEKPPTADALRALGEVVPLRVRPAPYTHADGPDKGRPVLSGKHLEQRMKLAHAYKPDAFSKAFRDIAGERPK